MPGDLLQDAWAHSRNDDQQPQMLVEHLENVAALAESFTRRSCAGDWGYLAGLLHDVGKGSRQFQDYIRGIRGSGGQHALTGAACAAARHPVLAFAVAGHHAGLPDRARLRTAVRENAVQSQPYCQAVRALEQGRAGVPAKQVPELPSQVDQSSPLAVEMFVRMVASALVDADYLDTERHFQTERAEYRDGLSYPSIADLANQFFRDQRALSQGAPETPLNRARNELYRAAVKEAARPQGVFTMTAPTGIGKTRSALGFAFRHALEHDLERIIFVIPYTSIIEQTARTFRNIFSPPWTVLEHHSGVKADDDSTEVAMAHELAAENWDAPIIATTSVQLFESLLGNKPSRLRKLHRVARSVIVLDETQLLPVEKLRPLYSVIGDTARGYFTTFLLMTATQPSTRTPELKPDLETVELTPSVPELFASMKRVDYTLSVGTGGPPTLSWDEVAQWMLARDSVLAVVNTKRDAASLYGRIRHTEGAFHLSTSLCGRHRSRILEEVSRRLAAGKPCRLVSTQLIEAGVDVDFQSLARAVGPLVSIVQAAGRCNREGRQERGEVLVFVPEEGGMPPGPYRTGTDTTLSMIRENPDLDLDDPVVHQAYFGRLYQGVNLDRDSIQSKRTGFEFARVARDFRMIDQDTTSVVVEWDTEVSDELAALGGGKPLSRVVLRKLQPYMLNLYEHEFAEAQRHGWCEEVCPGLWQWTGAYDRELGLQFDLPQGLPIT